MTDVNVVTSCSFAGWEKYGRRFVETFDQWPKSVVLHIVSEDDLPKIAPPNHKVVYWALNRSRHWRSFDATNKGLLWTQGTSSCPRPEGIAPRWRENSGHNFRYDAYKFSKKVFAIDLVAEHVEYGRLLWIDADVLTFAPVPEDLAVKVLPDGYALSHLHRIGYHSECGFVGYNLGDPTAIRFIKEFAKLYDSGEVFKLAEWHDSWVFDWLRNKLMIRAYPIPHRSKGHPFINSELGKYMDHLKGKRKDKGRSYGAEQVVNAKLPYWQQGLRV